MWRRFGDRVLRRPGAGARRSRSPFFAAGALGLLAYKVDYSTTTFFKKQTESVDGFKVLERPSRPGSLAPDDGARRARATARCSAGRRGARRSGASPRVPRRRARSTPTGQRSRDGRIAELDVVLQATRYKSVGARRRAEAARRR